MTLLESTTRTIGHMADGTPVTFTMSADEKRAILFGGKR